MVLEESLKKNVPVWTPVYVSYKPNVKVEIISKIHNQKFIIKKRETNNIVMEWGIFLSREGDYQFRISGHFFKFEVIIFFFSKNQKGKNVSFERALKTEQKRHRNICLEMKLC